nr:MAG TPA: hypothetical protein [Caudoviricetes sp.]
MKLSPRMIWLLFRFPISTERRKHERFTNL